LLRKSPKGQLKSKTSLEEQIIVLLEVAVFFGKRAEKNKQKDSRELELPTVAVTIPVFLKCKFCGELLQSSVGFCQTCGKSQI
jgi:hypothetical protein